VLCSRKDLQVECQLQLGIQVAVEDFEKSMNELFQVNISLAFEVHYCEQTLAYDAWQRSVLK